MLPTNGFCPQVGNAADTFTARLHATCARRFVRSRDLVKCELIHLTTFSLVQKTEEKTECLENIKTVTTIAWLHTFYCIVLQGCILNGDTCASVAAGGVPPPPPCPSPPPPPAGYNPGQPQPQACTNGGQNANPCAAGDTFSLRCNPQQFQQNCCCPSVVGR